jgi:hypothetical protein
MSFFDLINSLRKGEPNVAKAAKVMKGFGWFCLFGGLWNFIVPSLFPADKRPFNLPPDYPALALIAFVFVGTFFFLSSRGIANKEPWGKRLGQVSVILLLVAFFGLMFLFFSQASFLFFAFPRPVLIIFSVVFIGQFVVPAWFGISYLGRLPVRKDGPDRTFDRPNMEEQFSRTGQARYPGTGEEKYKDALVPIGLFGTFFALIAVPLVITMIAHKLAGPGAAAALFLPFFILIFAGPILYNRAASSFEQGRSLVESYTGGGSTFMMNGSWPFFRLLIYTDGVEIRVLFHRFFLPYDRMEDLPPKLGFFSMGIPFRSDLPGVPSSIRFYGFRNKDILARIQEQRSRFLAEKRT